MEQKKNSKMRIKNAIVWLFFWGSFLWMLKSLFLGFYPDFSVYYYGSELYLSGQNPYLSVQQLFSGYSYPPTVFLIFSPLTLLTFQNAEVLWTILNIIFLVVSIILLAKIFSVTFFSKINLLLSGFIFLSFPVKFTLGMGQINILILFLLVFALFLLKGKKEFYSGLLIGLSLGIKIFPILLPLYFFIKNKQKVLFGLFSCLGILAVLVFIFVPKRTYLYFIQNVVPYFFSASWKLEYYSQSLSAFVGRTFGTGEVGNIVKVGLTFFIITIVLYVALKVKKNDFLTTCLMFGFFITATMLINTFSWQHHYVWLIIPFYSTIIYFSKIERNRAGLFLLCLSYFLVSINLKNPEIFPVVMRSHVFYGTMLLFLVQIRLLLSRRKN